MLLFISSPKSIVLLIVVLIINATTTFAFGPSSFHHTVTMDFNDDSTEIGWLLFSTCAYGGNSAGSASNYNSDYTKAELFDLLQYAVTVQIGPIDNEPGVTENANWTVTADICSNPVFALNNQYEVSFELNMTSDPTVITDYANVDYWIGTTKALTHIPNACKFYEGGSTNSDPIAGMTPKVWKSLYQHHRTFVQFHPSSINHRISATQYMMVAVVVIKVENTLV